MTKIGRGRRGWIIASCAVALLFVIAIYWQSIMFGVAVATSEQRPVLLVDADWQSPASAGRFNARFMPGTPESDLIDWLRANGFTLDRHAGHAGRRVHGVPCNEIIDIAWGATSAGKLQTATAIVTEAGCL